MIKQLEFLTNSEDQLVYVGTVEGGNETPLDITYDSKYVGNPLSIGTKQLTWEGRRLKQIIDGTNTFTYSYNEQGLRTKKNINGVETKYYLQGSNIIAEEKNGQTIHYIYNEQNQLVGLELQQNKYFYVRDLLRIIRNIIDVNGNIVVTYNYDAWGNHKVYDSTNAENTSSSFIGNINPFRYKGYYYDVETGLFYCSQRYYDPEIGRWISADDVSYLDPESINGLNLFAYCANNPVMNVDPSGCAWYNPFGWSNETKLIVGGAFIVAGLIVTVATGGAFLPALLATAKAVGISMAVSATIGGTVGGLVSLANDGNFWSGAIDGFMWGGIFAGTSQMLGSASKLLAGRQVDFSKNVNLLFGNQNSQSTTLLRINKAGKQLFRFDVDPTHLLHIHYGIGKAMRIHRWVAPLLGYDALVNISKALFGGFNN